MTNERDFIYELRKNQAKDFQKRDKPLSPRQPRPYIDPITGKLGYDCSNREDLSQ